MGMSGYLGALGDDELVALLRRRPDLATPSPVTLTSLAARATSRVSLERALAAVDAAVLQAVESVLALTAASGPPTPDAVVAAIVGSGDAADEALVRRSLDEGVALALVWPESDGLHAAPGLLELYRPGGGAVRDGRTHRQVARPPHLDAPARPAGFVAAESAAAAERAVRLVGRLVATWGETPPPVLRAGGLGVRDLRRLAHVLESDAVDAAFVVELAGAAGLVADDGEERPSFAPTDDADSWLRGELPARWGRLASAWLGSERMPWLVGRRGERGTVAAALEPELQRRWVPRVRAAVLRVLAELPEGSAPTTEDVLSMLRWRTPRAVPPAGAATALLAEAARLGVVGAGALAPAGRALLAEGDAREATAAAALAESLPPPVDEVLLQGDLTGIVPGRPSARLAALLESTAAVESRGGALTVRFTPETVRSALDAGATADDLLRDLGAVARGGVPQPLDYLVRDAARRHGVLRAGVASSYLRADDPALLAGLPDDPRLRGLGLRLLAPTVLAAAVPPGELVTALRGRGLAPVVEGPDGTVLHAPATAHRTRPRPRRAQPAPDDAARLGGLVRRLRRAEEDAHAAGAVPAGRGAVLDAGGQPGRQAPSAAVPGSAATASAASPSQVRTAVPAGTGDPASALLLLREAAAERALVWVEIVGGRGMLERRLLRPLSVDGGRLRAVDPAREAELVVAVHRIAAAERAS